jgi:hypothetical protein
MLPVSVDAPPYEIQRDLKELLTLNHKISTNAFGINGYSSKDSINVIEAIQKKSGLVWLVGIAALIVAAILIPIGLRTMRRSRQQTISALIPPDQSIQESISAKPTAIIREKEGVNSNQIWSLSSENSRLGRKRDENDIPVKSLKSSRIHAVINFNHGQYGFRSLDTRNPVTVNNEPMQQRVLTDGDVNQTGETILKFELSGEGI